MQNDESYKEPDTCEFCEFWLPFGKDDPDYGKCIYATEKFKQLAGNEGNAIIKVHKNKKCFRGESYVFKSK